MSKLGDIIDTASSDSCVIYDELCYVYEVFANQYVLQLSPATFINKPQLCNHGV